MGTKPSYKKNMKSKLLQKKKLRFKNGEWIDRQHGTESKCQQLPEQAASVKALSSKYQSIGSHNSLKPAELNSPGNIRESNDRPPNTTVFNRRVRTQIEG
jgi:hypothetical protein